MVDLLSIAKNLGNLAKNAASIETRTALIDAQTQLLEANEEIQRLRDENREIKEQLARKSVMQFRSPFFYRGDDSTPYCPRCWSERSRESPLIGPTKFNEQQIWTCPVCKLKSDDEGNPPRSTSFMVLG